MGISFSCFDLDQVVSYRGIIREKPSSEFECREYLRSYEHEPACTVTSVVVTNTALQTQFEGTSIARQWFHPIPDQIVDRVLAKGDIMYCAGGFMIDDPEFAPFLAQREGDEDSIIGLPLTLTLSLMRKAQGLDG